MGTFRMSNQLVNWFVNMPHYSGRQASKPESNNNVKPSKRKKQPKRLFLLLLFIIFAIAMYKFLNLNEGVRTITDPVVSFLVWDEEGLPELSPKWKAKRDKEIRKIDDKEYKVRDKPCIQYALIAIESGYYPILSCGNIMQDSVFLNSGDVWKYGKTCYDEEKRYRNKIYYQNEKKGIMLNNTRLRFVIQTTGTEKEMLIIERKKIYNYSLLPENILRKIPLPLPPGNKQCN